MKKAHMLYKIYYGETVVYIGRTNQPLQNRIRGHLFSKPMHRTINIDLVSKIEYAEFSSEADMYLYEIYFINKYKPMLNVDDKTSDALSVSLPDVEWKVAQFKLWQKWKEEIHNQDRRHKDLKYQERTLIEEIRVLRKRRSMKEINEDDYMQLYASKNHELKEIQKILYNKNSTSLI